MTTPNDRDPQDVINERLRRRREENARKRREAMTTRRQPQPHTRQDQPRDSNGRFVSRDAARFQLTDRRGNVIATAASREEALELQRQQPELTLRGVTDGAPAAPSAGAVVQAREQREQFEEAQEQFEEALEQVQPFMEEGRIDVVAALESGVSAEVLEQVAGEEAIQSGQRFVTAREQVGDTDPVQFLRQGGSAGTLINAGFEPERVEALEQVREFLTPEGGVDAFAALQAGVPESVLDTALQPGAVDRILLPASVPPGQEGPPQVRNIRIVNQVDLRDLGFPFGKGDVVKYRGELKRIEGANRSRVTQPAGHPGNIQIFFTDGTFDNDGDFRPERVSTSIDDPQGKELLGRNLLPSGVPFKTPEELAQVRRFERIAQEQSAGLFDPRAGEAVFDDEGRFVGRREPVFDPTGRIAGSVIARPGEPLVTRNAPAIMERLQSFEVESGQFNLAAALEGGVSETELRAVGFQQQDIAQARAAQQGEEAVLSEELPEDVRATLEALEPYRTEGGYNLARAFLDGAITETEAARAGFGSNDIARSIRTAAALDFPEGTRFQLRDPETGESRGFAAGPEAIEAARQQGFDVVPVTIERAERPPQTGRFPFPEEDLDVGPGQERPRVLDLRPTTGGFDLSPRLNRQQQLQARLQQVGATEAIQSGFTTTEELEDVFGAEQVRGLFEAEEAGLRTVRQAQDPGQQLAMDRLRQEGFADARGNVDVVGADEAGQRGLLLQAGFTPQQIDAAVERRTVPTAEARRTPPPGETFDVPEDILERHEDLLEQESLFLRDPQAAASTPQFIALSEERQLISDVITGIEQGDITEAEARQVIAQVPEEPSPEQVRQARRNAGELLQLAPALAPGVGIFSSAAGTALTFAEDEPWERGLNIGTDVVSLVPMAGVAAAGARTAGAARGVARVGSIGRMAGAAEITPALLNPKQLIRGTITDPVEAVIRPSRIAGTEETFTTLRITAPGEQGRRIKTALSDAAIELMQTGQTATRQVEDLPAVATVRAGALHRTIGPNAVHSTPDGRNILAGPITVSGREQGLFVAPTPLPRFAEATAFGRPVDLTEEARAAVRAGVLPDEPVPTAILIRDPELLAKLEPALDAAGKPKMFGNLAEVEAVLPNGTVIPQASQVRFLRGADGQRIAVAVIGDPISTGQMARLKVGGLTQQVRNVFRPGAVLDFEGSEDVGSLMKSGFLQASADDLLEQAAQLRRAGRVDEALQLERAASRIAGRSDELARAGAARPVRAGGLPDGLDTGRLDRGEGAFRDTRTGDNGDVRVFPGAELERRAEAESPLTRQQAAPRIDTLSLLANAAEERPLTDAERQQVQRTAAELARADLTPRQRARVDTDLGRLRQQVPELTRTPVPTRVPTTTETPRTPGDPRTPGIPRVPSVTTPPRTPDAPRVPGVPTVPQVPRPPRTPPRGLPGPDDLERDGERGRFIKVVGISRGAVGDTQINLATGQSRTVQDIEAVPETRTRNSFTVLQFGSERASVQRERWGAKDLLLAPDGSFKWVKAGSPIPPLEEFRPAEEFGKKRDIEDRRVLDRQSRQTNPVRQRNPFRSRGMGRRRGF